MNRLTRTVLKKLRKRHAKRHPEILAKTLPPVDYAKQEANDQIRRLLEEDKPCMISRMGGTETPVMVTYLDMEARLPFLEKAKEYVRGERDRFWWEPKVKSDACSFSGIFPPTDEMMTRYAAFILGKLKEIDLLGVWLKDERGLADYFSPAMIRVPLDDLEPYFFDRPWSELLAGKKVLVIHPFEESIQKQYAKRELLFKDPRVLPSFELKTLKAVQSLVGNQVEFPDWFAALEFMCRQVDGIDFDIAIIGAGAYGIPLAAHVKELGKKAIHLGAATQLLFGIRGKRWEAPEFSAWGQLFNEHWSRPLAHETPSNSYELERGAYW